MLKGGAEKKVEQPKKTQPGASCPIKYYKKITDFLTAAIFQFRVKGWGRFLIFSHYFLSVLSKNKNKFFNTTVSISFAHDMFMMYS